MFAPASSAWVAQKPQLSTPWSEVPGPQTAHREYPRPQLQRSRWLNLNGLWSYAITAKEGTKPAGFAGEILVPFPVESALSGVQQRVDEKQRLWYKRTFSLPQAWRHDRILLHFEAVDWETEVWVNGVRVGAHRGGYDPFYFDITTALKKGAEQELLVAVWDPTDSGTQPRGKQVLKPGGIFYTPSTGIWGTVWLEPVSATFIQDLKIVADADEGSLILSAFTSEASTRDRIDVKVLDGEDMVAQASFTVMASGKLTLANPKLWSPSSPHLYDVEVTLQRNGKIMDQIRSYAGLRKITVGADVNGVTRLLLNNEFVFQKGPLDQGFWPDGLYTPPCEEAMVYDLRVLKAMGFNMLRKHVKVESRRFYYWCDRLGLLVWQDMPSGDAFIGGDDPDIIRTPESAQQYYLELERMIATHFNHPSIIMWVPFNEGWGQFESDRVVQFIREQDSTRLVNQASGWTDRGGGDVNDWHRYPGPGSPLPEANRAAVLGEFGGLGLKVRDHMWTSENWGYQNMTDFSDLRQRYEQLWSQVWELVDEPGLSAAVYTQTTDVETEANGLMTYDRRVIKLDTSRVRLLHTDQLPSRPQLQFSADAASRTVLVTMKTRKGEPIHYSLDESEPSPLAARYIEPVRVDRTCTLRAAACTESGCGGMISRDLVVHAALCRQPEIVIACSPKYGGGAATLVDGLLGSAHYNDGCWSGWQEKDMEVVIDLGAEQPLRQVSGHFLQDYGAWIFLPRAMEVLLSKDGASFTVAGSATPVQGVDQRGAFMTTLTVEAKDHPARYVKIKGLNTRVCPAGHPGAGKPAWIFVDEVMVE